MNEFLLNVYQKELYSLLDKLSYQPHMIGMIV